MSPAGKDGRRLTGYANDGYQQNASERSHGYIHHQSLYDDDMDGYDSAHPDDVDVYDDDESEGSVLSVPDPNIDFDLVYALHTFAATVEGQASVVKGDALTLLDDSNSYWWLVKVLKTSEVGYIPAENIETPYERLARLNSHRNVELTQRDIQDAFPAPPSSKPKSNKRVTMAKGVKFQAQVIFGSSDDEDFEEEFEEWQEMIRSDSDTDDSSDDDMAEYAEMSMYKNDRIQQYGQSPIDNYAATQHSVAAQHQQQQQQQQNLQQPHQYYSDPISTSPTPDLQTTESSATATSPSGVKPMSFRDTLDLEQGETIKLSLTPSIARGTDENGYNDYQTNSKQRKANKLEALLSSDEAEQNDGRKPKEQKKEKSGLRKLFSRNKDGKKEKQRKGSVDKTSITDSVSETASLNSQSTGYSERERMNSVDSSNQPEQPVTLKIHPGNIQFGEEYKVVQVYPITTAAELIQQVVDSFEGNAGGSEDAYLDYSLTVKSIDGDEYTLVPLDRPLTIYYSLNTHLSTPMPSLKKARRISQLMANGDSIHIGTPKPRAEEIDEVRFYLHSKSRRSEEGYISLKASLLATEVDDATNSIFTGEQTRIDKQISVAVHSTVSDVTSLLLEKFHILNGIAEGVDARSLRLPSPEGQAVRYRLHISKQGHEYPLDPTSRITEAFGDAMPAIHYRRSSTNHEHRASIASLSSVVTSPYPDETFFMLRRSSLSSPSPVQRQEQQQQHQEHQEASKPVRPPRPVRQNTPMPRQSSPLMIPEDPHPSQPYQQQPQQQHPLSTSPTETGVTEYYEEPGSAVDVLMKLDEALDSLAHTRNSNEPLTEAITSQMGRLTPETAPVDTTPPPPVETQQPPKKRQPVESMLLFEDLRIHEMMALIRAAARYSDEGDQQRKQIRPEIAEVFKDSQSRIEQLEKELDTLMAEAVKAYS